MNFNIAIVFDDAYAHHAWAMLTQLKKNVRYTLTVHCVLDQLSEENLAMFAQLTSPDFAIQTYEVTATGFEHFVKSVSKQDHINASYMSRATYIKLFLPEILSIEITRVLYLDCDLEVRTIDAFIDLEIDNVCAAACRDTISYHPKYADHVRDLGIKSYLNAGVIYMNLERLRTLLNEQTLKDCIMSLDGLIKFHDQDFWNKLISDDCLYLPVSNNLIHSHTAPATRSQRKTASIIHYTGHAKRYRWSWYLILLNSKWRIDMLKQLEINLVYYLKQSVRKLKGHSKSLRRLILKHLITDEVGRSRYQFLRQNKSLSGRFSLYRFICCYPFKKP